MSLTLAAANGVRLQHTWYTCTPGEHARYEIYNCSTCDGGLSSCIVCHASEGQLTTHCPGPLGDVGELVRSLIFHAGLDYVDGTWRWKKDEFCYRDDINRIYRTEYHGTIDRFIAYAENRMTKLQQTDRQSFQERANRLIVTVMPRAIG